jgi:hypothetical protein
VQEAGVARQLQKPPANAQPQSQDPGGPGEDPVCLDFFTGGMRTIWATYVIF